ncbi:MAG: hypothetical protein IPP94_16705 [Ignavibacteria bacterium]|nr:hypothetical protein [Ignavibacteria bacterium]
MEQEKIEVYNLNLGKNILHVLESHEVTVELLVPKNALPYFNMCEEHFYEGIEAGSVPSCVVDGTTLIPVVLLDPEYCESCARNQCNCDEQDDEQEKLPPA